jgi:hypothetical protein
MKRTTNYILCILFVNLCLSSCGLWKDNIKLSTKSAVFSGTGDSILIVTKGGGWWVSSISVDNKNYANFPDVDIHSDSYVIKEDCFVIERREKYTLFIKLDENPLDVNRIVIIVLEDGDFHAGVTITQKSK